MTTMSPTTTGWTTLNKVGLGLTIFYAVVNIPSFLISTPEGETGPPLEILVACTVLGVIGAVAGVMAWRSGSRAAARLAAGAIVVITATSIPAFFVDVPAGVKVLVGVSVILTLAAVVLTFSSRRSPA